MPPSDAWQGLELSCSVPALNCRPRKIQDLNARFLYDDPLTASPHQSASSQAPGTSFVAHHATRHWPCRALSAKKSGHPLAAPTQPTSKLNAGSPQVLEGHSDEIWHVAFSHDGRHLGTASKDGSACLWAVKARGEAILSHTLPADSGPGPPKSLSFLAFSPDDSMLLTCGSAHEVRRPGLCSRLGWVAVLRGACAGCQGWGCCCVTSLQPSRRFCAACKKGLGGSAMARRC